MTRISSNQFNKNVAFKTLFLIVLSGILKDHEHYHRRNWQQAEFVCPKSKTLVSLHVAYSSILRVDHPCILHERWFSNGKDKFFLCFLKRTLSIQEYFVFNPRCLQQRIVTNCPIRSKFKPIEDWFCLECNEFDNIFVPIQVEC